MLDGKTLLDFSVVKAEGVVEQQSLLRREGENTQSMEGEVFSVDSRECSHTQLYCL